MGQPVVHFEIVGKDPNALHDYYSNYGILTPDQTGIGGGVGPGPEGYPGHVTFYVGVPDVEEALAKAESLGGSRMMGPDEVMEGLVIGLFNDPEGHLVGVVNQSGQ